MYALTLHAPFDLRHEKVADPVIGGVSDALVRVEAAAICGSDLHPYRGHETGCDPGTVMGHEFVGRVEEVGAGVRGVRVGDRVVSPFTTSCGDCHYCRLGLSCRCERGRLFGWMEEGVGLQGAQAEWVRVPLADSTLVALPEELKPEVGLLLGDVLPTGYQAARLAEVAEGEVVAVLGCGPVGLMAVVGAREHGAGRVFAFDPVPERRALAARFGAEAVDLPAGRLPEELADATSGRGADAVLEAVGTPVASRLALDLLRPGGRIAAVGVHTEDRFAFSPAEAYDRNLTYRAGRCPARELMEELLPMLSSNRYPIGDLISHSLPLEEGRRGYELFDRKLEGCTKVVLLPG